MFCYLIIINFPFNLKEDKPDSKATSKEKEKLDSVPVPITIIDAVNVPSAAAVLPVLPLFVPPVMPVVASRELQTQIDHIYQGLGIGSGYDETHFVREKMHTVYFNL